MIIRLLDKSKYSTFTGIFSIQYIWVYDNSKNLTLSGIFSILVKSQCVKINFVRENGIFSILFILSSYDTTNVLSLLSFFL